MTSLFRSAPKIAGSALALSLATVLAGCSGMGMADNRSLDSVHQPIVERVNYTLDVTTGPGGLSYPEQRRLAGWFEAMDLRYGDRISVDDPLDSEQTRAMVSSLAGRYGLIVGDTAPATQGYVTAGTARIIVTRAKAHVPGCPDWSAKSDFNPNNASTSNYGCATNANLAVMVADPEHLLKGAQGSGETTIMTSNKAIGTYREKRPTGADGIKSNNTKSGE